MMNMITSSVRRRSFVNIYSILRSVANTYALDSFLSRCLLPRRRENNKEYNSLEERKRVIEQLKKEIVEIRNSNFPETVPKEFERRKPIQRNSTILGVIAPPGSGKRTLLKHVNTKLFEALPEHTRKSAFKDYLSVNITFEHPSKFCESEVIERSTLWPVMSRIIWTVFYCNETWEDALPKITEEFSGLEDDEFFRVIKSYHDGCQMLLFISEIDKVRHTISKDHYILFLTALKDKITGHFIPSIITTVNYSTLMLSGARPYKWFALSAIDNPLVLAEEKRIVSYRTCPILSSGHLQSIAIAIESASITAHIHHYELQMKFRMTAWWCSWHLYLALYKSYQALRTAGYLINMQLPDMLYILYSANCSPHFTYQLHCEADHAPLYPGSSLTWENIHAIPFLLNHRSSVRINLLLLGRAVILPALRQYEPWRAGIEKTDSRHWFHVLKQMLFFDCRKPALKPYDFTAGCRLIDYVTVFKLNLFYSILRNESLKGILHEKVNSKLILSTFFNMTPVLPDKKYSKFFDWKICLDSPIEIRHRHHFSAKANIMYSELSEDHPFFSCIWLFLEGPDGTREKVMIVFAEIYGLIPISTISYSDANHSKVIFINFSSNLSASDAKYIPKYEGDLYQLSRKSSIEYLGMFGDQYLAY